MKFIIHKYNYICLGILSLLLISPVSRAQFSVDTRILLPIKREAPQEINLVPIKDKGLVLISVTEPWHYDKNKTFTFSFIDTTLKVQSEKDFLLPYDFADSKLIYYDDDSHLYFFSQSSPDKEVLIFRLNLFTKENNLYEFELPINIEVTDFEALGDQVYLMGEYGSKPVVIGYSFNERLAKVLPSFYEDKEELKSVQADPKHRQIHFVMEKNLRGAQGCETVVKPYSNLIGLKGMMRIDDRGQRTAEDALVYSIDNDNKLVMGTYNLKCSGHPQGVYIANFQGEEQKSIRYTKFTDLSNFFNYYRDKKAERMRRKVEKKRDKGSDYKLKRRISTHGELFETDKELILITEGYYTSYRNTPYRNQNSSPNLNNYPNNPLYSMNNLNRVAAITRNQFNYAVVCGFDKKGVFQWDNVMKIEEVEQPNLNRVVQPGYLGDSLILAYLKEEEIYSKLIHRYRAVKEEKMQEISELFKNYGIANYDWQELVHWYGDVYLLYGEQRLKNSTGNQLGMGNQVFHVNKLRYYPQEEPEEEAKHKKEKKEKEQ